MRRIVATNLKQWMDNTSDLDKQSKLATRSGVAQSHIGRILRQESSATVDILDQLSRAFGKKPEELLTSQTIEATTARPLQPGTPKNQIHQTPGDYNSRNIVSLPAQNKLITELNTLAAIMSERGLQVLIYEADKINKLYPKAQANSAS